MNIDNTYFSIEQLREMIKYYHLTHPQNQFIGNQDVDMNVLLSLELEALNNIIKTNKLLYQTVMTDNFWCKYLQMNYNVHYTSECLHIGQKLLSGKMGRDLFEEALENNDLAIVQFYIDVNPKFAITVNHKNPLSKTTYVPIVRLLLTYQSEEDIKKYLKEDENDQFKNVKYILANKLISKKIAINVHDKIYDQSQRDLYDAYIRDKNLNDVKFKSNKKGRSSPRKRSPQRK